MTTPDSSRPEAPTDLDAMLAPREDDRWQRFYVDRGRPCPFFVRAPDENLAQWLDEGAVAPGAALDPGCGNARNAIFLARRGFRVEAVDRSPSAIAWATDEVAQAAVPVTLRQASVFELRLEAGGHDLVYDSGCFHHIAPHRRNDYVDLVAGATRRGGHFGLVCFAPDGGSGYTDTEVYERRSLGGGLGYEASRLREIWSPAFDVLCLRRMRVQPPGSGLFGQDGLWVMLGRRR